MIAALLCAAAAAAGPPVLSGIDVTLEGGGSTAQSAILRMMNTSPGQLLNPETLEHDLSRLASVYDLGCHLGAEHHHLYRQQPHAHGPHSRCRPL